MATPPEPPRRESHPPSTPDPLVGQWEDLRHQLRSWWDRLTEADLAQIGGQRDRLISVLQQRYGHTRERAQQEVARRLQEYGEQTAGVAATGDECRSRRGLYGDGDRRDRGRESPGDGGGGGNGGDRYRGWGRDLRPGKRRAGPAGRPRGAHPPPPRPGPAHRAGDWLCPRPQSGHGTDGSELVMPPGGAPRPRASATVQRQQAQSGERWAAMRLTRAWRARRDGGLTEGVDPADRQEVQALLAGISIPT